jgi:precorrin-6B methylase 2
VGVGVAAISIAMCRIWPGLRVVGIDPYELALSLANRNVERAGLSGRIELRRQGVEQLDEVAVYDLAWLAGPFLSRPALEVGLERVREGLRPGGWVVLGLYVDEDPLRAALARLRTARSGGAIIAPEEAERLLRSAGLVEVATMRVSANPSAIDVVGRRAGR